MKRTKGRLFALECQGLTPRDPSRPKCDLGEAQDVLNEISVVFSDHMTKSKVVSGKNLYEYLQAIGVMKNTKCVEFLPIIHFYAFRKLTGSKISRENFLHHYNITV